MANPKVTKAKQPDGTTIDIRLMGDEFYSWNEDVDGYTIIKDTQTKFWSYAKQNDFGELEPSEHVVGKAKPLEKNIKKELKDENKFLEATQKRMQHNEKLTKSLSLYSRTETEDDSAEINNNKKVQAAYTAAEGKKTNFVLLIEFSDLKFSDKAPFKNASEEEIRQGFDNLFNKQGYTADGAVGSVKDYFTEISYGKMEYESVISPIVSINSSYLEYAWGENSSHSERAVSNFKKAIVYALKELDNQGYDFKALWPNSNVPEGFTVIHAGGGAESDYRNYNFLWSHKSEIDATRIDGITFTNYHTEPAGRGYNGDGGLVRIGVICHESLHFFGLPDLYDTYGRTSGLGNFCIMAAGEWNGNDGNRPAHPSAWCKYKLGLINCQTAVEGSNSIGESATEEDAFYIFKPSNFNRNEYFIMENRQSVGFDKSIPGSKRGILIYHVDERKSGNDLIVNNHYLVALEEAGARTSNWKLFPLISQSGRTGSDSDYFRSGTISYFNDSCSSSPNSKSYSGSSSGIKISEISSSSSMMSFACGKEEVIIEDLSGIVCYPNPARDGYINITNLPTDLRDFSLEIFTLTSKLVKSFSEDDTEYDGKGIRTVRWDCKNDSGEDVAPGVYIVLIKNDSRVKKCKVAVIR